MLAKSKISEALINNEINHEDFMTTINEERNYRELKENTRMMKGQASDTECNSIESNFIEEGNKIDID